jgi:hypothetical protein
VNTQNTEAASNHEATETNFDGGNDGGDSVGPCLYADDGVRPEERQPATKRTREGQGAKQATAKQQQQQSRQQQSAEALVTCASHRDETQLKRKTREMSFAGLLFSVK